MAALTNAERTRIWRALAERISAAGPMPHDKTALKAAADAAQAWADSAAISYNSALTTNASAFASTATPQEKALLLAYICLNRAGLL